MRAVNEETARMVYELFADLAKDTPHFPNGVSPSDIAKTGKLDCSYSMIALTMQFLEHEGYVTSDQPELVYGRKKYYKTTSKPMLITSLVKAPKEKFEPKNTEDQLEHDLNSLIEALELTQEYLPKVMAGLLDMSKHLDKFRKIKSLLNSMTDDVRKRI